MNKLRFPELILLPDNQIISGIDGIPKHDKATILLTYAELKRRDINLSEEVLRNLEEFKTSNSITDIDESIRKVALSRGFSNYQTLYDQADLQLKKEEETRSNKALNKPVTDKNAIHLREAGNNLIQCSRSILIIFVITLILGITPLLLIQTGQSRIYSEMALYINLCGGAVSIFHLLKIVVSLKRAGLNIECYK
jgi:hypothetical protein